MSIIPVAIVAAIWYHLAQQGMVTSTIWLGCNVLDTLRALRLIRPSGRAVGQRTRRKAMRDALLCWVTFIVVQQVGWIPDKLVGWLPVYSLVRSLVVSVFLFARVSASETIYTSVIQPTLRRYETPIDLTIELVSLVLMLACHFILEYPLSRLQSVCKPYISKLSSVSMSAKTRPSISPALDVIDLTQTDEEAQRATEKAEQLRAATNNVVGLGTGEISPATCVRQSPLRSISREEKRSSVPRPAGSSKPAQLYTGSPSVSRASSSAKNLSPVPPKTVREHVQAIQSTTRPSTTQAKIARTTQRQPPVNRTAPTVKDANIPVRADPLLMKSKSSSQLKTKTYATDIMDQRPVKSAPTRRTISKAQAQVQEDPNSPRAKRLVRAAERAREIRERRRREPGVTPGEKRPAPVMSKAERPGSKRTKITVARD